MKKTNNLAIISVMFCFFCMGFVDLVGIASNYVKADLHLSDSVANIFPSLVFFWFLIFSVPTGVLMNKIGRKKTVLLSLGITALSLLLPLCGESFAVMLCAFSLLGIGNALMQTSLNPLVTCVMGGGHLAAVLTFGQFIKAIASFIAPYLAIWGTTQVLPSFGYDWRILFAVFLIVGIFATALLATVEISEPKAAGAADGVGRQFSQAFALLGKPLVLLTFLGIMCHVGIDVGTNTVAPKIIMERMGLPLEEASFATGVYFIFRTVGCFLGALLLRYLSPKVFFAASVLLMLAGICILMAGHSLMPLYIGIALIGFGNSNVFSVVFSQALVYSPEDERNEVSGLMIMGLFGGTVFPLAMGFAADAFGQIGSVAVMAVGVVYLMFYTLKIKVK